MTRASLLSNRFNCPCCDYPTLTERAGYEICELCNWEDDGQSDSEANEVWGGPNSDYSLAEARRNFAKYRVMYQPDRDMRLTGADSELEQKTKILLMAAFEKFVSGTEDQNILANEILRLEEILAKETARQVREYEAKQGS